MKSIFFLVVVVGFSGLFYFSSLNNPKNHATSISNNENISNLNRSQLSQITERKKNIKPSIISSKKNAVDDEKLKIEHTMPKVKQAIVSSQGTIINKKMQKLESDLLNKELQADLKNELKNATKYRENILMKAKQEMNSEK